MNPTVPITLADLIRRGSNLDAREAERLAVAWSTEIRLELEQTGISVIRGVGTLTLSNGRVRFQQDPDFPIGSELPAVEGFSEAVAASLQAASSAPKAVPKTPETTKPVPEPESEPESGVEAGSEVEAPPAWEELAQVDEPAPVDETPSEHDEAPVEAEEISAGESETASADFSEPPEPAALDMPEPTEEEDSAWSEGMEAAISKADEQFNGEEEPVPSNETLDRHGHRSSRAYAADAEGSSRWVMAIAAIIVLVVIGALLYRFVLVPDAEEPPALVMDDSSSTEAADSTGTAADSTDMAIDDGVLVADPVVQDLDNTQPATTPQVPTSSTDAGSVTAGMGGYTLIVGSTLNATAAERVRTRFTGLGLPTGVLPVTADSTTRYRIAVGHFPTAAEADTLRIRRASELPEGTWVLSVR